MNNKGLVFMEGLTLGAIEGSLSTTISLFPLLPFLREATPYLLLTSA